MISIKKRHEGITLVEAMLVLVIGATIIYMGMQQYFSYRRDADVMQVIANVNTLFQSMTGFYKQECYGTEPGGTLIPGKLNPTNPTPPAAMFPINIVTDLREAGYLTTSIPLSSLVNPTGAGTQGYITQFNRNTTVLNRQTCMEGTDAVKGPHDPNCTRAENVGEVVVWTSQVAVRLNHPAQRQQYLNLLAGDCLSSAVGNMVTSCSMGGNPAGEYVVWERLPSNASVDAMSSYWPTMPSVSQFKQMYTTYSILNLTNESQRPHQYYYCGN
ncbi:MAG: hypothetical protein KIT56_01905 [Gammaproteobacteria bacterium]|nr:hypothetical protein [Gammaproteobacteria bacterium]MCW5582638.1 hypothetical protein [Gammaproteobacteria bacterium]